MRGLGVGKIVHYKIGEECLAGIVTKVHDRENGVVNVAVFHSGGGMQNINSAEWSEGHEGGYWHWPENNLA